ncbi:type II toxin-antitoxin system VapC family toxin [Chloroflexi bacterium TSY]|nr:type II toxin-antitoxin system VapC family toxin [Chloroflexi bacterium TSY]
MSILYLDTSALAKRYLTESGWTWIQSLIDSSAGNTILAAEITRVEVAAALSARHRATDGISQTERDNAVRLLVHHCNIEYMMIPVDTTVLDRALTLTQNHRLRGYDAVQLATALVVNEQYLAAELPALTFVTADADLVAAGDAEGLVTDDPNRYG